VDEFLKEVSEPDLSTESQSNLVEISGYHHSVVETDMSIHIFWKSEPGNQNKESSRRPANKKGA